MSNDKPKQAHGPVHALVGRRIRITESCDPYYAKDEIAILHHIDDGGDWWAVFAKRDKPRGFSNNDCWCVGNGDEFELLDAPNAKNQGAGEPTPAKQEPA